MNPFIIESNEFAYGSYSEPGTSSLHVRGVPLDSIQKAHDLFPSTTTAQRQDSMGRFWSSRPRFNSDRSRDVFEIALTSTRTVNLVSLEIARFPHTTFFQYLDQSTQEWTDLIDPDTGSPVSVSVTDSLPSVLYALSDPQSRIHPQHFGAGHWVTFQHRFLTVKANRFRVVMVRIPGSPPVKFDGTEVAYSLGARGLLFGFDATSRELIPHTEFITPTERAPFGDNIDPLRSPVSYMLRENRPQNIIDDSGIWKSEPQPIRNAVVNLFVDARDKFGDAQVVDRFYVKPLYTGPKVNLYYTTDAPRSLTKDSLDSPLARASIQASNNILPDPRDGISFFSYGTVDIDNSAVRFAPGEPFFIGITISPDFDSTDTSRHVIFDIGNSPKNQNLVQDAQDSLGLGSLIGYTALADSSMAVESGFTEDGIKSIAVTTTGLGSGFSGVTTASRKPIKGGDDLTGVVSFKGSTITRQVQTGLVFYDAAGVVITTVYGSAIQDSLTSQWVYPIVQSIAPANAAYVSVVARITGPNVSEVHYVGRVSVYPTGRGPESMLSMIRQGQTWIFSYNGSQISVPEPAFVRGQRQSFCVQFDGSNFTVSAEDGVQSVVQVSPLDREPERLRFADYLKESDLDGSYLLRYLTVKNGAGSDTDVSSYLSDPEAYVVKTDYLYQDDHSTDGSILRFAPDFVQVDSNLQIINWGFVGGPLNDYSSMLWYPINQDFDLRQGEWHFLPVSAKFFKFEFSDLTPQPFDMQAPVIRKVNVFPDSTESQIRPNQAATTEVSDSTKGGSGTAVSQDVSGIAMFADSAGIAQAREGVEDSAYTATQVVYAEDPLVAARLRGTGASLDYVRIGSLDQRRRFDTPQVHRYREVEINHEHKVAFFAGLTSLRMHRTNYRADDNTAMYLELFHDNEHFQAAEGFNQMAFVPGQGLRNIENNGIASMRSVPLVSRSNVIGLQFAAQQSEAFQLLTDPDFDDSTLAKWGSVGDATIQPSDDFTSDIGSTIKVERRREGSYWDNIEVFYPTWDFIDGIPWGEIEGLDANSFSFGGVRSLEIVETTPIGRVHASARVYASTVLSAPLSLQIVDSEGSVLAEEVRDVAAGEIAEWYVSYSIGDQPPTPISWATTESTYADWDAIEGIDWDLLETVEGDRSGGVSAVLVQKNPTTDVFYVDNISIFDDPIIWEFSNDGGANWYEAQDIRNNPRGVMIFPTTGNELLWRVKSARYGTNVGSVAIRPWYNDAAYGVPYKEGIETGGASRSSYDLLPPILVDPRWRVWSKPIPESWYFASRQWLLRQRAAGAGPVAPLPPSGPPDPVFPSGPFVDGPNGTTSIDFPVIGGVISAPDDSGVGFTVLSYEYTAMDLMTFRRYYVQYDDGLGYDVVTASSTWTSTSPVSGQTPYVSLPHSKVAVIGYPGGTMRSYDLDSLDLTEWTIPAVGTLSDRCTGVWGVRNGNSCRVVVRSYSQAYDPAQPSFPRMTSQNIYAYDVSGGIINTVPVISEDITYLAGNFVDGFSRTEPTEIVPVNAAMMVDDSITLMVQLFTDVDDRIATVTVASGSHSIDNIFSAATEWDVTNSYLNNPVSQQSTAWLAASAVGPNAKFGTPPGTPTGPDVHYTSGSIEPNHAPVLKLSGTAGMYCADDGKVFEWGESSDTEFWDLGASSNQHAIRVADGSFAVIWRTSSDSLLCRRFEVSA